MTERTGLVTAVELVRRHRNGEEILLEGEQLPLIPTEAAREAAENPAPAAEGRGAGRPPGARNKRTAEWVEFILSRYRSPIVALAEIYSRPVEVLRQELGCTLLEAFQEQRRAAEALLPYLHQKQPLAVQIDSRGVVQLVIVDGDAPAVAEAEDGLTIEAKAVEIPPQPANEGNQ